MYKWLHYFDRNHPVSINEDREELESLRVEMRGYLSKDGNKIKTERGDIHLIPKKEIVPKQKIPIIKKKTAQTTNDPKKSIISSISVFLSI